MEAFPEKVETSESLELVEGAQETWDQYRKNNLKEEFKAEVDRIVKEERFLGEGRAASVFAIDAIKARCKIATKIWKDSIQDILKNDVVEYRKIQSLEPYEEFKFQDSLYISGFKHMPRPLAFVQSGGHFGLGMEEIEGFNLNQIREAGAKIESPSWEELKKIILKLNNVYGVVHRDLHDGNIMLKTKDELEFGARLRGELYIIDFGHAKRTSFSSPEPDDFKLTIGQKTVKFPMDFQKVSSLRPTVSGASPFVR